MLSTNRKFHFIGDLIIKRSKFLKSDVLPKDDEVNWMFIEIDETNRYSFVYKIEEPQTANYNIPFTVRIAITFYDLIKNKIKINKIYSVMRGEEKIGTFNIKVQENIGLGVGEKGAIEIKIPVPFIKK